MIRIIKNNEIGIVSKLLEAMTAEVFPTYYDNTVDFESAVINHMKSDTIYVDDGLSGFFIIKNVTDPLTPTNLLFEGTRLYIKPECRNSSLLSEFYAKLFKDYPEGNIIGITEIDSKHIPVLEKRHTRIANVYKLNRS